MVNMLLDRTGAPAFTWLLALLHVCLVLNLPYVDPDDSPLQVNRDYFDKRRRKANPTPGPFQKPPKNGRALKVW